jgi:hypothetical protein
MSEHPARQQVPVSASIIGMKLKALGYKVRTVESSADHAKPGVRVTRGGTRYTVRVNVRNGFDHADDAQIAGRIAKVLTGMGYTVDIDGSRLSVTKAAPADWTPLRWSRAGDGSTTRAMFLPPGTGAVENYVIAKRQGVRPNGNAGTVWGLEVTRGSEVAEDTEHPTKKAAEGRAADLWREWHEPPPAPTADEILAARDEADAADKAVGEADAALRAAFERRTAALERLARLERGER